MTLLLPKCCLDLSTVEFPERLLLIFIWVCNRFLYECIHDFIIGGDSLVISQSFYPSYVSFASIVYNMLSFMDEFCHVHISHVGKQYNCSTNLLTKKVLIIGDFFCLN